MNDPDALSDVKLPEQQVRVWGHGPAREGVLAQLRSGRLPGAILMHGPQGIGKATLAFDLAREILTATGDEDAHRVAEQVTAGSHPNLQVLRRQPKDGKGYYTVIRVEDIRDLREKLRRTRGRQGNRIAVIDSIDDCNPSAANALLKTLEEPPADTTFLLVSHRPGQLLPTIKSRCHNMALRPVSDANVETVLTEQRQDLSREEIERALALAGGRPRRAFETLDLGAGSALGSLQAWLIDPARHAAAIHVQLAETLGADAQSTELSFAREMLADWLADEARNAAMQPGARMRLASANELWDKAHALFAEADSINLDMKQTLVAIFDAIRKHIDRTAPASFETR